MAVSAVENIVVKGKLNTVLRVAVNMVIRISSYDSEADTPFALIGPR